MFFFLLNQEKKNQYLSNCIFCKHKCEYLFHLQDRVLLPQREYTASLFFENQRNLTKTMRKLDIQSHQLVFFFKIKIISFFAYNELWYVTSTSNSSSIHLTTKQNNNYFYSLRKTNYT